MAFFIISWRKWIPNAFTFAALCAGVGSILASALGYASTQGYFYMAALLIMISLILDGLDGTVARLLKGQTGFGAELDTFVDITSFGTAPAVLLFLYGMKNDVLTSAWGAVLAFLIVMSGASRLSRFRLVDPYRGQRGYLGLPITVAAGLAAMYVVVFECAKAEGFLQSHLRAISLGACLCMLAMLVLQVSTVRYSKPTKNPLLFVPFAVALGLLFWKRFAVWPALGILAYGLWYAFVSPFFFQRFLAKLPPVEEETKAGGE